MASWPEQRWLLVVLLVVSAATHLMWLGTPREVVFDEVHFGKFVTAYCCTGERFFDIHPPHAKLLIAGVAYLTGYSGEFSFAQIGQSYGEVSPLGLRLLPALSGMLLPLVIFGLLRQLGAGQAAAFFGAAVLVFDNALTVQTRLISLDGLLLLASFGSLSAFLAAFRSGSRRRWGWFVLAGALAGLAVGVKFTGLVALGLLGVLVAVRLLRARNLRELGRWVVVGLVVVVSALAVYMTGWAFHFGLLTEPGSGDAWRVPQLEQPLALSFVRETYELHKLMLGANYGLTAGHPDSSSWWEWPIMRTSVFYWQYSGTTGHAGTIYLIGNPLVWWLSSALLTVVLLVSIGQALWRYVLRRARWAADGREDVPDPAPLKAYWIPLLGYFASYLPLVRVPRALFLYHYLTPLIFAVLVIMVWLDAQGIFQPGSVLRQPRYYFVALGVVAALFFVFSPLTYGFLLSPPVHDQLFWLTTWR